MQELGAEYLRATNALLAEDFKRIGKGHPNSPTARRNRCGDKEQTWQEFSLLRTSR
jgi:hypothetical protein